MSEIEEYIRARLTEAFNAALQCPACEAPLMMIDPRDPDSKWCGICGHSEPLSANRSSDV